MNINYGQRIRLSTPYIYLGLSIVMFSIWPPQRLHTQREKRPQLRIIFLIFIHSFIYLPQFIEYLLHGKKFSRLLHGLYMVKYDKQTNKHDIPGSETKGFIIMT